MLLVSWIPIAYGRCHNNCNMHGTCTLASVCKCDSSWEGNDCSLRTCPRGPILGDIATGIDASHQMERCSGRGECDHKSGACKCDPGWSGLNCGKTLCINNCSGHGVCISLYDAAIFNDGFHYNRTTSYRRWDAHMFHGCKCDSGYGGQDCSMRVCEAGPDPRRAETIAKKYETATLVCRCPERGEYAGCNGKFKLNFMGQPTRKWLLPTSTGRDIANLLLGYAPKGARAPDGERQGNYYFAQNDTRTAAQPAVWAGINDGPPVTGAGESNTDPDDPDGQICQPGRTIYTNIHFKRYAYDLPALSVYAGAMTLGSVAFETYQTLSCDCTANNCNGTFRFTFDGEISRKMTSFTNASILTHEIKLLKTVQSAGITKITHLNSSLDDDTPVCIPGSKASHTYKFTAPFGNVARLGLWSSIGPPVESRYTNMRDGAYDTTAFTSDMYKTQYYSSEGIDEAGVLQLITNDGRDNNMHECNGIGSCDYSSGVCRCPYGWTYDVDMGPCGRLSSNSSSANGPARCPGYVHRQVDTNLGFRPSRDNEPSSPRMFFSSNRKDGVSNSRLYWHGYDATDGVAQVIQPVNNKYQTGRELVNLTSASSAGPIAYDASTERLFFADNNANGPFIGYVGVTVNESANFDYYFTNGVGWLPLTYTVFVQLDEPIFGMAFDPNPAERKIYWTYKGVANYHDGRIGYARVDDTRRPAGVQYMADQIGNAFHVVDPMGIAVHPREQRIYWVDRCCEGDYKNTINSANIHGDPRRRSISIDKTIGAHTSTTHLSYTDIVIDWYHNNTALVLDAGTPAAIVAVPLDNVTLSDLHASRLSTVQMRKQRLVAGTTAGTTVTSTSQLGSITVDSENNVVMWTDKYDMAVYYAYVEPRAEVLGEVVHDLDTVKAHSRAYLGDMSGDSPVGMALDFGMSMQGFNDGNFLECYGNGICGGHATNYRCICFDGSDGDCSKRQCPKGKAWFHEPMADEVAHDIDAECSNMGVCEYSTGRCACAPGFEGAACERIACRGQTIESNSCGGNGRCLSMRELARKRKTPEMQVDPSAVYGSKAWNPDTWDADMAMGCSGDEYLYIPGTLHNVSNTKTTLGEFGLECPYGVDHRENEMANKNDTNYLTRTAWVDPRLKRRETQRVLCTAEAGEFKLTFRNYTTIAVGFDATPQTLQAALEALPTIGHVKVLVMLTSDVPNQVCSTVAGTAHYFDVVFMTELGPTSMMVLSDTLTHSGTKVFSVTRTVVGSGTLKECSGKGDCDRKTGVCNCYTAWGSSDGYGGRGTRGDCGYSLILTAAP